MSDDIKSFLLGLSGVLILAVVLIAGIGSFNAYSYYLEAHLDSIRIHVAGEAIVEIIKEIKR